MEIVNVKSTEEKVKKAKELMLSVGNKIGSVYFTKKENGKLRKMCYRIHVHEPKYAKVPEGGSNRVINERNKR